MDAAYAGPIENVVVVMFARRSYDSVLGCLYDRANAPPFDRPPPSRRELDGVRETDCRAGMLRTAVALPVTAFLAHTFMVCDRWFAAAPAGSYANRLFACAAAPGGLVLGETTVTSYVADDDYAFALQSGLALEPNVFSRLDAVLDMRRTRAGRVVPNWKLYFHDYSVVANLLRYVGSCGEDPRNVNLANYDECDYPPGRASNPLAYPTTTFLQDVAQGTLPPFAMIEPRYAPGAPAIDRELLLLEIYLALRGGRYWERTLLIVTYDECGATGDHAIPPAATPPGRTVPSTPSGFAFDRFGPRVPAIVVSAYAPPGSVLRPPPGGPAFDHTSIVKTVWECFGLAGGNDRRPSINARDAAAPSVLAALSPTVVNLPIAEPVLELR